MNTSNALAELYNVIKLANLEIRNKDIDLNKLNDYFKTLNDMFMILGLDISYVSLNDNDRDVYQKYLEAKANKDFEASDKYRQLLIDREIM